MFDISAVGASVLIKLGTGGNVNITHFSDEGTPFECPDADFSVNQKNLNGDMISSRAVSVYVVSVTVIPNSAEDIALSQFAQANALQPGNVTTVSKLLVPEIQLSIPKINASSESSQSVNTWTWTNGRLKSAPTGPSTSAEGRLAARTYTFEMEKMSVPSGTGSNISSVTNGR